MMQNKLFEILFNEVGRYLPEGWDSLVFYLEYGADSYAYNLYLLKNDDYENILNLLNVKIKDVQESIRRIDEIVSSYRDSTKGELWTNLTMVIHSDGHIYSFDYDYTDLTDCAYSYKKKWKKKYLVNNANEAKKGEDE